MFRARIVALICVISSVALVGCRQKMAEAPYYDPLEYSAFFADQKASRDPVAGTVPRGHLRLDDHFYTGKVDGQLVTSFPYEVTRAMLERGQERYEVFCTPCHGLTGEGNGMIVQRGHRKPPSFHEPRMIEQPIGHWVDVMTNGFGAMPSYSYMIEPHDRWAIAAYVRVLQMTRQANASELPADARMRMENQLAGLDIVPDEREVGHE